MRGWAHVGVISVLDEIGLQPDIVAGCSAGALMGAYYAAGYSLEEMNTLISRERTSSLFSFRFDGLSLLSNDGFRAYLEEQFGDVRMEDLGRPLYVICTDLDSGREVVLQRGRLVEAIMASTAIPGIFEPVVIGGRRLVDGGLTNNVPVSALINHGAHYTIGVRLNEELDPLTSPRLMREGAADENAKRGGGFSGWTERIAAALREFGEAPKGLDVFSQALAIVMAQIEGIRLQVYQPDILIAPAVSHIGTLTFSEDKKELYQLGVEAARRQREALEELRRRIDVTSSAPTANGE